MTPLGRSRSCIALFVVLALLAYGLLVAKDALSAGPPGGNASVTGGGDGRAGGGSVWLIAESISLSQADAISTAGGSGGDGGRDGGAGAEGRVRIDADTLTGVAPGGGSTWGSFHRGYTSHVTTYSYDRGDRLRTVVDSLAGTIQRDFDGLDRLELETTPQGSISYTYDDASRPDTMTVAGQPTVDYTFDDANRLTRITRGSQVVDVDYDELNRPTVLTLPGAVTETYSYDDASRLTGITYKRDQTALGELVYGYDAPGRRSTVSGSWARTALPDAVSSMVYDANNRLIQRGATTLSYDDNGNLLDDGSTRHRWDSRNQLVSTSGQSILSNAYDGSGRRIRKSISGVATELLYDGDQIVQEKTGGVPSANLLTGLGADEVLIRNGSEGSRNLLTDALGSTVALTDAAGSVLTSYTYEPFGKTTTTGAANSNPYQFTGREADTPSLYNYRARYHSAALGRFISEDPLGFGGGDTNLYAYVGNSPGNFTDPSGMCLVGAILGGAEAMSQKKGFWGVVKGAIKGCVADLATGGLLGGLAKGFKYLKGLRGPRAIADDVPTVLFSRSRAPGIAQNFDDAVANGAPTRLTRVGAATRDANRRAALRGQPPAPGGQSLDEYPFACSAQGGCGSFVRAVPVGEQSYQGGVLSRFFQDHGVSSGDSFDVRFVP